MTFYLSVILGGTAAIALVNILFSLVPVWYYAVFASAACTALAFALDGLCALVIHLFPSKWFLADSPRYRVLPVFVSFYEKLGVKRWKDKVWELGGIGGFSKKSLSEPLSAAYIERFLIESHKGVLTHRVSYVLGFLPMLLLPGASAFTIALPVALVNLYLNILPTIVLRYNTPRLLSLYGRLKRKEEKAKDLKSKAPIL